MISIVVPVYNEADNIQPFLRELEATLTEPHETLIVYDFPEGQHAAGRRRAPAAVPDRAPGPHYARQGR